MVALEFPPSTPHASSEVVAALMRFVGAITRLDSVRTVRWSQEQFAMHLWVLLEAETSDEATAGVYSYERELRRAIGALPLDVHVFRTGDIDEAHLPSGKLVYEKSGAQPS